MNKVVVMKKVSEKYEINAEAARREHEGALVLDVTRGGLMEALDAGSPWGNVEVPGMEGQKALSVKQAWEGLKVFRKKGSVGSDAGNEEKRTKELRFFQEAKSLGKTRGCKSYGKLEGIKIGDETVGVEKAAKEIFEVMYKNEVKKRFGDFIENLRGLEKPVVLLDYREGEETLPWSSAELLKEVIEAA